MADKKKPDEPVVSKSSAKEARTAARKAANRAANEAAHKRNVALKAAGKLTPHEEKKAARAKARAPKKAEFERRQAAALAAEEQRRLRAEANKEKVAAEVLAAHKRTTGTASVKAVAAARRTPSPVTVRHIGE